MKVPFALRVVLPCAVAVAACRFAGPGAGPAGTTTRRTVQHDGSDRSYIVHVPAQAESGRPLPVVLNFHGGGGNAEGQQTYSRMDDLADEAGFIVVYPEGSGPLDEALLTWNAGGCCGYASENGIDDVGFVRTLVADLGSIVSIDTRRVYATGLSNGAMMAYRLAAEAPDLVAAIAPVAGAMQLETFEPGRPVPVLHIHSVDDPRALYDGGLGPRFPATLNRVDHVPVEEVLGLWAANNGCEAEPAALDTRESRPSADEPPHTATLLVYPDCDPGGDVEHWRLTGAGHVWPGGLPDYLTSLLGPGTDVIDANREMWAFFQRFALPM